MTGKVRFSLDANILVYSVDRDAGERYRRARDLVWRASRRNCVLTTQALAEFFHATTRKKLLPLAVARAFVQDWFGVFDVVSADPGTLAGAMDAVEEHRFSFWDAMLWATVRQSGCSALLSEDMQGGQRVGGVEIINPFAPDADTRLADLLEA